LSVAILLWKPAPRKLRRFAAGALIMIVLIIAAGVALAVLLFLATT
jgi:hypothetical protein